MVTSDLLNFSGHILSSGNSKVQ